MIQTFSLLVITYAIMKMQNRKKCMTTKRIKFLVFFLLYMSRIYYMPISFSFLSTRQIGILTLIHIYFVHLFPTIIRCR